MKKFMKLLLIVIMASAVAAVVASAISKQKLSGMSDEEIREYLASKIGTKVGDEQLASIQDAVIAGVRRGQGVHEDAENHMADSGAAIDDKIAEASNAVDDVKEESASAAGDAAAVVDAAEAIIDQATS